MITGTIITKAMVIKIKRKTDLKVTTHNCNFTFSYVIVWSMAVSFAKYKLWVQR